MSFIKDNATIFLGLHGGIGESGQLQKKLEKYNVVHNGSGSEASALCMDKWKTNKVITSSRQKGLYALPQKKFSIEKLRRKSQCNTVWELLRKELHTETCIIKPHGDGCSSGVVHLYSADDLWSYMCLLYARTTTALSHTFTKQTAIIEMPNEQPQDVLFEAFVKTDTLEVKNNKLHHKHVTGMVEVTCGVIQNAEGILHAFNPSITVAQGDVLSVEEKFQGGTGVNLTPPPESIMSMKVLDKVKKNIVTAAKALDIAGYARIDAFVDITTGDTYIIEANTLPALTPSTVIYQQALAEKRPMFPRDFLEVIINNVMKNTKRK